MKEMPMTELFLGKGCRKIWEMMKDTKRKIGIVGGAKKEFPELFDKLYGVYELGTVNSIGSIQKRRWKFFLDGSKNMLDRIQMMKICNGR